MASIPAFLGALGTTGKAVAGLEEELVAGDGFGGS